jgi:DNA-binding beta-propeller fold protein YncE
VGANGGLSPVTNSPFTTGFSTPLGVSVDPDGGHLFAWNHGSAVAVSRINNNGSLTNIGGSPFSLPAPTINPFAGSVAPDGDHLYTPSENNNPDLPPERVVAWSVAANGAVSDIQVIASGDPANKSNPFGSAITPDGEFLYVSNPEDGANGTVSGFAVNSNGTLSSIDVSPGVAGNWRNAAPGNHPLNMAISPDGDFLYVATRVTNTVNAYRIAANGSLSTVPGQPFGTGGLDGKALALTPDGSRLYISNLGSDNISGFNVASNGALTLIPGSPWATGGIDPDLESLVITPNQPPTAAFNAQDGEAGRTPAQFNANPSDDSDGTVARYAWDFGDGTTLSSAGPTPDHLYTKPGTYSVTLTVTDDEGCSEDRIFTGKATLCNGSGIANSTEQVRITAPPCAGSLSTVFGTSGPDVLKGTGGRDVISGFGGRDRIRGLGGNDKVCAGAGRDSVFGGPGKDRVRGGPGIDRIFGGRGSDRLNGGGRRDRLLGGRGDDRLFGGPGFDKLIGGLGNDIEVQ